MKPGCLSEQCVWSTQNRFSWHALVRNRAEKHNDAFNWARVTEVWQILSLMPRRHLWKRQALVVGHIRHVTGVIHLVRVQDLLQDSSRRNEWVGRMGLTHRERWWPWRTCVHPVAWLFKSRRNQRRNTHSVVRLKHIRDKFHHKYTDVKIEELQLCFVASALWRILWISWCVDYFWLLATHLDHHSVWSAFKSKGVFREREKAPHWTITSSRPAMCHRHVLMNEA